MLISSVIFVVCSLVIGTLSKSLPKTYPRCFINDPELSKCLLEATRSIKDEFLKGNRDLGMPPTAPLKFPLVEIAPDGNPTISFAAKLRNVTIRGLENYEFRTFTFDPKTLTWYGEIDVDHIIIEGDADVHGKILVLQLQGQSLFEAHFDKFFLKVRIQGELVNHDGVDYYNLTNSNTTITIGKGTIEFAEFRTGSSPQVSETVSRVLKENNDEVFKMLEKPIQDFISQFIIAIFNKITQQVPFNEILPKSPQFPDN